MAITHVALDDSKRVIVAGILRADAAQPELREIPNDPRQVRRLFERLRQEAPVRACYEAGVSGYDLYRQLTALGVDCAVIAPALTPRKPGERVKTDRRDAAKLVRLFRAGELTAIHVPTEAQEGVRDLTRCRDDVRADIVRWRHRVLKLLARHGRVYQAGKNWSQAHWAWLRAQRFDDTALMLALTTSLETLEQVLRRRADLDRAIAEVATQPRYRDVVGALQCFRGINTLSAMILVAEIVDFQRFRRPRTLMAYLGLVPSEYSSGDRHRRGALTKAGNSHARRVLVEAAWHYRHRPALGERLSRHTAGQPPALVADAWRAQHRLHRRYRHLIAHGKRPTVAVAAVARELAGFIWAAMTTMPKPVAA